MESVYGTKKYFQSLSGASDIYRAPTCRASANEYSSYHNTLGRHSTIGPYMHMNKHPAYSTDLSLSSQYGYNTWGAWPDARNMSPSSYSTKTRQSVKSFSIILTTAAFIILLAVVSIGGLAFYFSTFKSNLEEPIMAFEGSFRILKGDSYTSGLRYNHTSIYRQKADFYKRFVERSLSDNDLQLNKMDITGFGDGPLIDVHFMAFLDMRKIPQTIHSVEEHIRNSLFLETNSLKSLYKSLKIEPDSVEIKRIIDENVIKLGSIPKDQTQSVSQTHFEKRLTKKTGPVEKIPTKLSTPRPKWKLSDGEPEVDVANAPVIQGSFEGSFEITKTDADITEKKTSPTKSFSPYSKFTATSIAMRSKTKKVKVEKTTTPLPKTTSTTTTAPKKITTTSTTTPKTTTRITTTEAIKTSTTEAPTVKTTAYSSTSETTISEVTTTKSNPAPTSTELSVEKKSNVEDPPKLDMNLFTSAPVLDTEPWRPMRPSGPQVHLTPHTKPTYTFATQANFDAIESGLIPRNKIKFSDPITDSPNEMIFYHSFTNPVFMPGTTGIERLGNSDVKPHQLPVTLIDDVVAPDINPILPMHKYASNFTDELNQFEHIGGGVIVRNVQERINNHSQNEKEEPTKIIDVITTESSPPPTTVAPEIKTEFSDNIGDLLFDLLDIPANSSDDYIMESRIEEEETEKPNFLNIKEMVLNKTKITTTTLPAVKSTTVAPLGTIDQSMLFPSHTKWEYVNSSSNTYPTPPKTTMKRIFNNTLQAWIVENLDSSEDVSIKDLKIKRNTTQDIQNISLIFDTLASKLGISSSFPTKVPPFSTSSQNKRKQSQSSKEQLAPVSTTTTSSTSTTTSSTSTATSSTSTTTSSTSTATSSTSTTTSPTSTTTSPSTQTTQFVSISSELPQLLTPSGDRDPIMGEAEVEVVDPTKYEEILSSQSASSTTVQTPTLVTLLPVRSNSGIRTFKPMGISSESRRFNFDSVVKTGIQVTS